MASVGGISCSFVRGTAGALKERVELWQRPGLDGYGAQKLGLGDSDSSFRCSLYGDKATVYGWIGSLEALQGSIAVVVNDDDESVSLLISDVTAGRVTAALGAGGYRAELVVSGVVT